VCTGTPVHYKQTVRLSCSGDSCFIKRRPCPDRGRGRLHGVAHSGQERRVGPGARGLHSIPFQLNLSCFVPHMTQHNP